MPMQDFSSSDRRRTDRRPLEATGRANFAANLKIVNVGPRGVEVETSDRLMIGADYDLEITSRGEDVQVRGTVDPTVLAGLRSGAIAGFGDAIRARLFTELGSGLLDVDGVFAFTTGLPFGLFNGTVAIGPTSAAQLGHAIEWVDQHGLPHRVWIDEASAPGLDEVFDMEQFTRWRLMEGLDDIGLTLRHTDEIDAFEASRAGWLPSA